jgi:hypothetical protein
MKFSSKYEPHELVESPILPRADMVKSMRRTGVLFRLINHIGWADKEFIFGNTSEKTNIRDLFFDTRDQLGISNIQLVDKIVELLIVHLKPTKSWFAMSDFPHAETWWWVYSKGEVSDDWIVNNLTELQKATNRVYLPIS